MMTTELAAAIKERIDTFCMAPEPDGLGIAVSTLDRDAWNEMPLPETIAFCGWLDLVETDGHPSGVAFLYCPEIMADSVTGLEGEGLTRYLDAVLLYITSYYRLINSLPDAGERRRKVEDLMYDHHPERLALMSLVQTGGGR